MAAGTYKAGMVRSSTFFNSFGVEMYGGFAGNEVTRESRDFDMNPVILSGDFGIQNNNTDNAFHVVVPLRVQSLTGSPSLVEMRVRIFPMMIVGKEPGCGQTVPHLQFQIVNLSRIIPTRGAALYIKEGNSTFSNCEFTPTQQQLDWKWSCGLP